MIGRSLCFIGTLAIAASAAPASNANVSSDEYTAEFEKAYATHALTKHHHKKTCSEPYEDTDTTACCALGAGFYTVDEETCREACLRTRDCVVFEYDTQAPDTCTLRSLPAKLGIRGTRGDFYAGVCTVHPSPTPDIDSYACLGGYDPRNGLTHRACVPTAGNSTEQECSKDCGPAPPSPWAACEDYATPAECAATAIKERCIWANGTCSGTSCPDIRLKADCGPPLFFNGSCTWAHGKCDYTPDDTDACARFETRAQCDDARPSDLRAHRCTWATGTHTCSLTPHVVPLSNFTCETKKSPGWLEADNCSIAMFLLKEAVGTPGAQHYCCNGNVLSDFGFPGYFEPDPKDVRELAKAVGHGASFSMVPWDPHYPAPTDHAIHTGDDCPTWIQWVNYLLVHNVSADAAAMVKNGTVPTQACHY